MARIQFEGLNDFSAVTATGPAAPYVGATGSSNEESESKSSKKGSIGGLDSDMVKWLYQKGLSSDVGAFMEQMEYVITNAVDPVTGRANIAMYKMLLPQLARVAQEKEQFDDAMDKVRNNSALDEIAVSTRGEVYVVGEDGKISLEDPTNIKNERVLTNGELAKLRATDPHNGAFKTDLTTTIANGTSMTKIYDYLKDALTNLGSNTIKGDSYVNANGEAAKGAKEILDIIRNSGGLKLTSETINSNPQIQEAFNFIMRGLPKNMQTILQVRANKTDTTVEQLISNVLHSKTGVTVKNETSYIEGDNYKKAKDLENKEQVIDIKPFTLYTMSHGGSQKDIKVNAASNINITLPGRQFSQLVSSKSETVPDGSLKTILDSGLSRITNTSNGVYVANKRVDTTDFDEVLIETGQVSRVLLPSTYDNNGVEHPVFDLIDQISKFEQVRNKLDTVDKDSLYQILQDDHFATLRTYVEGFDENNEIVWKNATFKPYLLLNAAVYADEQFLSYFGGEAPITDTRDLDNWATPASVSGSNEDQLAKKMKKLLPELRKNGTLYRTLVYLPMSEDSYQQSLANQGSLTYEPDRKKPTRRTDIRRTEETSSRHTPGNIGSSVLNN